MHMHLPNELKKKNQNFMLYHFKIANTCKCLLVLVLGFFYFGVLFLQKEKRE